MATTKSTRPGTVPDSPAIPAHIRNRIETERRRLQQAGAVLACLIISLEYEDDWFDSAEVVCVVRDLVASAVLGLDSAKLNRQPAG
jgi:hypothetical protein